MTPAALNPSPVAAPPRTATGEAPPPRKIVRNGRVVTLRTCENCGEYKPHSGFGWCDACYQRWDDHGRPEGGPPPARKARTHCAYTDCGQQLKRSNRGNALWCSACFMRWTRAGKPDTGPPPPSYDNGRAARLTTYNQARDQGQTVAEAAATVGVRVKTALTYEAERTRP